MDPITLYTKADFITYWNIVLYIVQYSTLLFARNISIELPHFSLKKPLHHVKLQSYRYFETNDMYDASIKIYDQYMTSY
jgi:hypothetical protein